MISITRVLETFVDQGKRIVKVLRFGRSDGRDSFDCAPYGIDSNPIKGMVALHLETGIKGKTVTIGYIDKNKLAEIGELRLYSTDDNGIKKGEIWLKDDGDIQINGGSDYAVRFSKLEEAFNQLKQDYNLHVHPAVSSGPITAPSTANISAAKVDTIRLP